MVSSQVGCKANALQALPAPYGSTHPCLAPGPCTQLACRALPSHVRAPHGANPGVNLKSPHGMIRAALEILEAALPLRASGAATCDTPAIQQRFARDSLSRQCNRRLHYHTSTDWRNLFFIEVRATATDSSIMLSICRPASPFGSLRFPVPWQALHLRPRDGVPGITSCPRPWQA